MAQTNYASVMVLHILILVRFKLNDAMIDPVRSDLSHILL